MNLVLESIEERDIDLLVRISDKYLFKVPYTEIIDEFASLYLSQDYEKDFTAIKNNTNSLVMPKKEDYSRIRLLGNKKQYENVVAPNGKTIKSLSSKTKKVQVFTLPKKAINKLSEEDFFSLLKILYLYTKIVKNLQNIRSIKSFELQFENSGHEYFINDILNKELDIL